MLSSRRRFINWQLLSWNTERPELFSLCWRLNSLGAFIPYSLYFVWSNFLHGSLILSFQIIKKSPCPETRVGETWCHCSVHKASFSGIAKGTSCSQGRWADDSCHSAAAAGRPSSSVLSLISSTSTSSFKRNIGLTSSSHSSQCFKKYPSTQIGRAGYIYYIFKVVWVLDIIGSKKKRSICSADKKEGLNETRTEPRPSLWNFCWLGLFWQKASISI